MRLWLLVLLASGASAQDYTREGTRPVERIEEERRRSYIQREAQIRREAETEEVTFEQILADPDNIDLNYRYARSQVLRGDLKGASATLERILLVRPDLAQVRLFRAVVLVRLGIFEEAERELLSLRGAAGAEGLQPEVERYLREARRARRKTRLSGRLSGGFQFDSNRNAAPSSGRSLFFDLPVTLTGDSLSREDTSLIGSAGVDVSHDLAGADGHKAFASLNYYRAEQAVVDALDIQAYSALAGLLARTRWADLTANGSFDHVLLAQDTYLRSRGGRLTAERALSDRLRFSAGLGYAYQEYVPTERVPVAQERTGNETSGWLGATWAFSRSRAATLTVTHTRKDAVRPYNAYDRESIWLTHVWLPGKGVFLLLGASGDLDRYDRADPFISSRPRKDDAVSGRLSFGVPWDLALSALKGFSTVLQYEYYHAFSNIINYQYDNHKASAMLLYRWEL